MSTPKTNLFNFNTSTNSSSWQIINDGVMGGVSKSTLQITNDGHGLFSGHVSLANNGGFASIRHQPNFKDLDQFTHVILKLKGDQKNYQFRLKASTQQRQSYVQEFKTNGKWQEIELKISDFYPQFRGQQLDMPNFNFNEIQEMAFLIANKKEEDFSLLIDQIMLR